MTPMHATLDPSPWRVWGEGAPWWLAVALAIGGTSGSGWGLDRGAALLAPAAAPTDDGATEVAAAAAAPSASAPASAPTAAPGVAGPPAAEPSEPSEPSEPMAPSDCPPLFSIAFADTRGDTRSLDPQAVKALASWLAGHPASKLVIQGHADARGPANYNFALSHRRAKWVASRFVDAGVPRSRVVVQAVGEFQPRVDGDLADNRRVVLRVTEAAGCAGAMTQEEDR